MRSQEWGNFLFKFYSELFSCQKQGSILSPDIVLMKVTLQRFCRLQKMQFDSLLCH